MSDEPHAHGADDSALDPLDELLAGCLEAAEADQAGALEAACAAHPEHAAALRARIARLRAMGMLAAAPAGADERVPERLGEFRVVRRLGAGGMGVVYLAVQESLGREVALKLIRPADLWFPGHRERFQRECQAVASLRHPGIVPIHVVGEQAGVPYYAMEYVAGRTLAEIVRALEGRAPETLNAEPLGLGAQRGWVEGCCELARQIAIALQHAHGRGVIHRDVKPSNVMVTADGRALLLDFGLASRDGADQLTRTGSNPGSLAYMSPEQLRGERLDARTDVYSLGVTLYELLTLRPAFQAPAEHSVREQILAAAPLPIEASNRAVPWDAATVCRTAFAPERGQRYASAAAFAADLEAFLAHRPIAAKRAGPWLRLRRFAQRRPALTTGLALGALLVLGTPTVLLWHERQARIAIGGERDRAEAKAATARRVTAFLVELFEEANPSKSRGASVPVRVVLERGMRRIRDELQDQPAVRADLMQALGVVALNLGMLSESESLLRGAVALRRQLQTPLETAKAEGLLTELLNLQGQLEEAEQLQRGVLRVLWQHQPKPDEQTVHATIALAITLKLKGDDRETLSLLEGACALARDLPGVPTCYASALGHLGQFFEDRDHYAKAEPLFRQALAILEALPGDHPGKVRWLQSLSINLRTKGDQQGAFDYAEQALHMAERLYDRDHPELAEVKEYFASMLNQRGEIEAAERHLDEVLASFDRVYPPDHPLRLRALTTRGQVAEARGEYAAAAASASEAVVIGRRLYPNGHVDLAVVLGNLAISELYIGAVTAAETEARAAVAMHKHLGHQKLSLLGVSQGILSEVLAARGNLQEAEQTARDALATMRGFHHHDHDHEVRAMAQLADVLLTSGNGKDAEALVHEALEMKARLGRTAGKEVAYLDYLLGWARHLQGDLAAAETIQERALAGFREALPPEHPRLAFPLNELGVVAAKLKKVDRAAELLAEAVALRRGRLQAGSPQLSISLLNLGTVRCLQGRFEDAAPLAWECLDSLRQGGGLGLLREGCVKLLLRIVREPSATAADLERVAQGAADLLPEGHALRQEVAARLERATSRPQGR